MPEPQKSSNKRLFRILLLLFVAYAIVHAVFLLLGSTWAMIVGGLVLAIALSVVVVLRAAKKTAAAESTK